jgi:hypothetical protein
MDINILFIILNILAPTSDISSIISCNGSYWHDNKFGKLNKDYWRCMFNIECIVKLSILKVVLPIDAISKAFFLLSQKICHYYIIVIILELWVLM